ncbi:MAG: hypothetical protein ACLUKN_14910 [Bacilli bacterium]
MPDAMPNSSRIHPRTDGAVEPIIKAKHSISRMPTPCSEGNYVERDANRFES